MKIWWRSGQLYHEFLWFKRKTPSPLCVNKKKPPEPPAPQKVVTTQISSCFQASPSSWLTWGLVCKLPMLGNLPDVSGADLVTQMHGEHPTNWRIDSMSCQIVSSTDNWKNSFKMEDLLERCSFCWSTGAYLLRCMSPSFQKSFKKKDMFYPPEKVFFIALLKVRRVYVDAGVQEQLVVYLMTSRKPRVFWLVLQRHPLHTPETLLRILFLTNVWWETHLFLLLVILNPSQLKVRVGFCFF